MAKNIILCSDGTGNRGGKLLGTNVWRLFKAVDLHGHESDPTKSAQITFYDDGVGTEDFKLFKLLGGAFGWGLSRNIRQLYAFLVKNYEPGDQIYLFGFSRGAFTVRSLGGLITRCGVLDRKECESRQKLNDQVKEAFRAYRNRDTSAGERFRDHWGVKDAEHAPDGKVSIHFIGVWDTVDAVGVPIDELRDWLNSIWPYRFHDHNLNELVKNGYHALSIDDERHTFHPVMWNETNKVAGQTIEQVWFPGVHSNVGGGYPKDELALVTLDWMMTKAEEQEHGLRFTDEHRRRIRQEANVHAKLYDSRSGLTAYYRYMPRDIQRFCEQNGIDRPRIHASVFERILHSTADYAPGNIPTHYDVVPSDAELPIEQHRQPREEHMKTAWDLVWWRRWLYYAFVLLTLLFLWTGSYLPSESPQTCEAVGCLIDPLFDFVEWLVPAYFEDWVHGYRNEPLWLLAFAIALTVLLWLRTRLKQGMLNVCHAAWRQTFGQTAKFPAFNAVQRLLLRLARTVRNSRFALEFVPWLKRWVLPYVVLVLAALAVIYWV